eukprot:3644541-Pleurochrysis_carterae.AAC.1
MDFARRRRRDIDSGHGRTLARLCAVRSSLACQPPTPDLGVRIQDAFALEGDEFLARFVVAEVDVVAEMFLTALEHATLLVERGDSSFKTRNITVVAVGPDIFERNVANTSLGATGPGRAAARYSSWAWCSVISGAAAASVADSTRCDARDSDDTPRTQSAVPPAPAVNTTEWSPAPFENRASPMAASETSAFVASATLPADLSRCSASRLRRGQSRCQCRPPQCRQGPAFSCHLRSLATRLGSPLLSASVATFLGLRCDLNLCFESTSSARPFGRSSSRLRCTSRACTVLNTSRIASSVRGRSPAADLSSIFTSSRVLMLSLRRRTTDASFSATRLSLSLECGGSERFKRANEWWSSLNSVSEGSASPLRRRASVIDSMASPAEADERSASDTSIRSSKRPELLQSARYVARVAGNLIVDSTLSVNCRSSCDGGKAGGAAAGGAAAVAPERSVRSLVVCAGAGCELGAVGNTNVGAKGDGESNV